MKLINKLLPLTIFASATAVVAPALTSCGTEQIFTIKFDANGGSTVADQKIVKDQLLHEPECELNGHILIGWKNGDKLWDFNNDKVTANMTLKAEWYEIQETSSVDLLAFDYSSLPQHEETEITETDPEKAYVQAAKMYYTDGITKSEDLLARLRNDILVQLSIEAKTLAISKLIDPELAEQFKWVGNIISARADVEVTHAEYQTNTNKALLSGSINLTLNAKLIDENTKEQVGYYVLHTQHVLDKVPYYITDYDDATHYWNVKVDKNILEKTSGWKLDRLYYGIAIYDNGEIDDEGDIKNWYNTGVLKELPEDKNLKPISLASYYLDSVSHGQY